jgi:hypothetical protein
MRLGHPGAHAGRYAVLAGVLALTAGVEGQAAGDERSEAAEPIRLEYHAAPGCPDRGAFEARVHARTTRARFVTGEGVTRTFVVGLQGGATPSGRFTVNRGAEIEGSRDVRADTCADVADALSLFVALAVDPSALMGPTTDVAGSGAPVASASAAASAAPSAAPSASSSVTAPPEVPPPPSPLHTDTPPDPVAVDVPSTPASPPPHTFFLGADFAMATGVSPDALLGFSPVLGWRSSSRTVLAPEVRLGFLRAASGTVVASPGEASFTWTVGRADGCLLSWPPGPARLQACARVEAGVLDATGTQIAAAHSSTRGWFAAGPLARAEWDLLAPLFIEAEVAAMVHATTDRFYFVPDTTIYPVPLLGLDASAGLGVHFL